MDGISIDRLISTRKKRGFSQKYVAISLSVAPSVVSRWESGIIAPSRESLSKLADLYGVSADYLMGKSDDEIGITNSELKKDEAQLIYDYRSLNDQGKEYIRQTMFMARTIYKKCSDVSVVENEVNS